MLDFTAVLEVVDVTGCLVILAALLTGFCVSVVVGAVIALVAGFIVEPVAVALTVAFVSGLTAGAMVVLGGVFMVALAAGAAAGLAAGFITWLDKAPGSLAGSAEAGTGVDCTGVTGVVGLGAGLTGCCSTGGKNGLVALLLAYDLGIYCLAGADDISPGFAANGTEVRHELLAGAFGSTIGLLT